LLLIGLVEKKRLVDEVKRSELTRDGLRMD
jgi:hypothetical protein